MIALDLSEWPLLPFPADSASPSHLEPPYEGTTNDLMSMKPAGMVLPFCPPNTPSLNGRSPSGGVGVENEGKEGGGVLSVHPRSLPLSLSLFRSLSRAATCGERSR